ncbi:MAG: hypothetical protein NTY38_09390 [Acidobacteria bacterium]|nr:hypothetical protein [Acidobacteriota bacterium]
MASNLTLSPSQGSQQLTIRSAGFPGDAFFYTIPEAIGSTARAVWGTARHTLMAPMWTVTDESECSYDWKKPGLLAFSVRAKSERDYVDVSIRLKNLGTTAWPQSMAFSCFRFGDAPGFSDFDGARTYLLLDGRWTPITQLERKDSPRPTIQLWYVRGGPRDLPFVDNFQATPFFLPEAVLAARSYDGKSVIAVTANKPLFLFANLEFSCIHCCPTFGALGPGEEGCARQRVSLCKHTRLDQLRRKLISFWGSGP